MNKKDILWAPWRIGYVAGNKTRGCFLCSVCKSEKNYENLVLYKGIYAFIILNLYPYNNGHLMVVPNRHIKNIEKLTAGEGDECTVFIKASLKILKKVLKPEGFNIGLNVGKSAGAGVEGHLHFHIVPRWIGDTNFMPVIAGTKVISQSLHELYVLLSKEYKTVLGKKTKSI